VAVTTLGARRRKEVVDSLHSVHAGGLNEPSLEFLEPVDSDASPIRDFRKRQFRFLQQLICPIQQIHLMHACRWVNCYTILVQLVTRAQVAESGPCSAEVKKGRGRAKPASHLGLITAL